MTRAEFLAWMARLALDRREAAAALGVSPRTLERYLRPTNPRPVSRTIELLCSNIERERVGSTFRHASVPTSGTKHGLRRLNTLKSLRQTPE